MKVERRKSLTRAEWRAITSEPGRGPVVRRVLDRGEAGRPEKPQSTSPMGPARAEVRRCEVLLEINEPKGA